MEQNAPAAMPVMDSGKQSDGKGLKIATIIASIVAACGIGFGVYGMVQSSQKDSQISDLKVQIKDSDGAVTTIETPEIETTTGEGTTVTIADSAMESNAYSIFSSGMLKNFTDKKVTAVNDAKAFAVITPDHNLEIHEMNLIDNPIFQQDDNVISVYHIKIGNGINNYFYYIKEDGEAYRVRIDEGASHEIEKVEGCHDIVSIIEVEHGGYYANLVDIDGNVFEHY